MNVYEISNCGEKNWVCAPTAISALIHHQSITNVGLLDFDYGDDIILVLPDQWKSLEILDPENPNEKGEPSFIETFADFMARNQEIVLIASTVY